MDCKFVAGQQVASTVDAAPLVKVAVYTIESVHPLPEVFHDLSGSAYVHLKEIVPPAGYLGFRYDVFRPVFKNDISVFTEMLAPTKPKVKEPEPA